MVGGFALVGYVVGVGGEEGACAALCEGEVLCWVSEGCGVLLRGVSKSFSWKGCRNLWKLHGKAAAQTRAPLITPASASVACWTGPRLGNRKEAITVLKFYLQELETCSLCLLLSVESHT